jgi:L-threonylcarbamoyladenylate synthase
LAPAHAEILTRTGNPVEAARNLFEALRRLDAAKLPVIVVEPMPEAGLGLAIVDRLQRAMRGSS